MIFIAQYAILRFAKMKGGGGTGALEAHHERTKKSYASNPDIDTERSSRNIHIVQPGLSYRQESDSRIAAAGCKTRKDSVWFVDTLITASPAFFKGMKRAAGKAFFERAVEFMSKQIGKDNIFTAVVHMDEKTPHMHLCFTPITEDGRLSAKEVIGDRNRLTKWQDDYFSHMVKAYPDLERGESASVTGRRHIPTRVFKQGIKLTKQMKAIQATLDGINPLNAKTKREEVLALLRKFFPGMEDFQKQVKKYEKEIALLEKDNADLEAQVKTSEEKAEAAVNASKKKMLATAQIKADNYNLQRFVDSLPEDIKRQARQTQQSQKSQHQQL